MNLIPLQEEKEFHLLCVKSENLISSVTIASIREHIKHSLLLEKTVPERTVWSSLLRIKIETTNQKIDYMSVL